MAWSAKLFESGIIPKAILWPTPKELKTRPLGMKLFDDLLAGNLTQFLKWQSSDIFIQNEDPCIFMTSFFWGTLPIFQYTLKESKEESKQITIPQKIKEGIISLKSEEHPVFLVAFDGRYFSEQSLHKQMKQLQLSEDQVQFFDLVSSANYQIST